jgi:hypothetical protein
MLGTAGSKALLTDLLLRSLAVSLLSLDAVIQSGCGLWGLTGPYLDSSTKFWEENCCLREESMKLALKVRWVLCLRILIASFRLRQQRV